MCQLDDSRLGGVDHAGSLTSAVIRAHRPGRCHPRQVELPPHDLIGCRYDSARTGYPAGMEGVPKAVVQAVAADDRLAPWGVPRSSAAAAISQQHLPPNPARHRHVSPTHRERAAQRRSAAAQRESNLGRRLPSGSTCCTSTVCPVQPSSQAASGYALRRLHRGTSLLPAGDGSTGSGAEPSLLGRLSEQRLPGIECPISTGLIHRRVQAPSRRRTPKPANPRTRGQYR